MSEQSDALNKIAREKGVAIDGPSSELPGLENDEDRPDLPWVQLPRGGGQQARKFSKEIGAVIGANGVFRRETTPVTIDPESGRIVDMGPERLVTYVQDQLTPYIWQRMGKGGSIKVEADMSVTEARIALASDAFCYPLRKLTRVNLVRLPVMRADGRIELLPEGYDPESQILTQKDCIDYATDWDLERAVSFLKDLFGEFPVVNERSLAAHVCAMVAIYGAALMPVGAKRLNFAYRANRPRSGKGLMLQAALVGPCGPFIQMQAIADSKEEFRKLLDTEALNGSPYTVFDEVENKLRNRTLNAYLTATVWTGRLMNSQKKFAVPQSSIVFIAGNNIELSSDLTGRFLLIDLYVTEADPQSRPIKHVMDEVYLARDEVRADLLSAMWALVRAWKDAKPVARPEPDSVYRGFESFSKIYGGIVQNAGFGNPMQSTAAEVDPDYADMLAIVERLADGVTRRAEYEFHDLIDVCRELHAFEWHLDGKMVKCKKLVPTIDAGGKEDYEDTVEIDSERFELTPSKKSWFGKLFGDQYGGTKFTLSDGRRVQFGRRGSNRQRRFTIEILVSQDQEQTSIDAES